MSKDSKELEKEYPHGFPDKKPDTIDKAIDILKVVFTPEQLSELASKEKSHIFEYHFSMGLWIRNNFSLWKPDSQLMDELKEHHPFMHPDSVSRRLIEFLWEDLKRNNSIQP